MKYDNTIDELIIESNEYQRTNSKKPLFISNWVPLEDDILSVEFTNNFDESINEHSYLYSIDDFGYKQYFNDFYRNSYTDDPPHFSLFSNATIALYLVFKKLVLSNIKNILAFSPCYFTSDSALQSLNFHVTYYSLIRTEDLNYDKLLYVIKKQNIQAILITDPIYGTGVDIELDFYISLMKLCNRFNLSLIIDYAYGNMSWNSIDHIFNYTLLKELRKHNINYFLVDSLPKRLFLNGNKFALLFSNKSNIDEIEQLSIFIEGSIMENQFKKYMECYDINNSTTINGIINNYCAVASKRYRLLRTFITDCDIKISKAKSGIFVLMGIPRKISPSKDLEFAKKLIANKGIFLIPHSRYKLIDNQYFYFKVNLLINPEELFEAISKIIR